MTATHRVHRRLLVEELEPRSVPGLLTGAALASQLATPATTFTPLDDLSFHFTFAAPELQAADAGGELLLIDGTGVAASEGAPVLPFRPVNLLLPIGYTLGSVDVAASDGIALGAWSPEIGSAPTILGEEAATDGPGVLSPDWQSELLRVIGVQRLAGYDILTMALYPVQYDTHTQQATFIPEITLTINTVEVPGSSDWQSGIRDNETDRARILDLVDNPWALGDLSGDGGESVAGGSDGGDTLLGAGNYTYVIITSQALEETFAGLRDHKEGRDVSATIVTTEDIYANYSGVDQAEKVRNFIRDAYQNWDTSYVLFGGDVGVVPYRAAYGSTGCYVDNNIPSDLYFSCLDGSWNGDGDAIWGETTDGEDSGEVDLMAEVLVGRAPVDTPEQAANFIRKTIFYENFEHDNLGNVVLIGEHLWDDVYGSESTELIRTGVMPPIYNYTTLYEEDGTFSKDNVINALNGSPHIVNHLGHGNTGKSLGIYTGDVDASLTNSAPFFAYSQACFSGDFVSNDSIAEHLVYNESGAFAVVMNSRYGFGSASHTPAYSHDFAYSFFETIYTGEGVHLGRANQASKEANLAKITSGTYRWIYFELNLMGDPETIVAYSNKPKIEALTVAPAPFTRADRVTLSATITSKSLPIQEVAFYLDRNSDLLIEEDELLGIDDYGEDGWLWDGYVGSVSPGEVRFLARARDIAGTESDTASVTATILNMNPLVGVVTASPNPVMRGDNITVTCFAWDLDGRIVNVAFYRDLNGNGAGEEGEFIGYHNALSSGYVWRGSTAGWSLGATTVLVKAIDNDGGESAFTAVAAQVINHTPNAGALTATPTSLYQNEMLTLQATGFMDPDGSLAQIAFYRDINGNGAPDPGELLGVDADGNDGWTWAGSVSSWGPGARKALVQATDNEGAMSQIVSTQVEILNHAPTIGVLTASPDDFLRGAVATLSVNDAADADGRVAYVSFYLDLNRNGVGEAKELLGADSDGGDGWTWSGSTLGWPHGSVSLLARAVDNDGAASPWRAAQVVAHNQAPSIALLSASPSAALRGQPIDLIAAGVSDGDGTATQVEFFRDKNGNGIGEAEERLAVDRNAANGWSCSVSTIGWETGPATLLARATDNDGAASGFASVAVNVGNNAPVIGSLTFVRHSVAQGGEFAIVANGVADVDGAVREVLFYRDVDGDGVGQEGELIGRDVSGSDGWSCRASTAGWPVGDTPILALAVDSDGSAGRWTAGDMIVRPVQWNPVVLDMQNRSYTFSDGDGDVITLMFSGPGAVSIYTDSLTKPQGEDIDHIEFYGTSATSSLMIRDASPAIGPNTVTGGFMRTIRGESLGSLRILATGGRLFGTTVHVEGDLKMVQVFADTRDLNLSVGGKATTIMAMGAATNTRFTIGGDLSFLRIGGQSETVRLDVDGGASRLFFQGKMTSSTIDIARSAGQIQLRGGADLTAIAVGGNLGAAMVSGGLTRSALTVGGSATTVSALGGQTAATLNLNGGAGGLMLSGGMDGAEVNVAGGVTRCMVRGGMRNASSIHITGGAKMLQVMDGLIAGSAITVDGDVSQAMLFGSTVGPSLDQTSSVTLGSLSRMMMVRGNLAGAVSIRGSAASGGINSQVRIIGNLSGDLTAGLFGNVMITGNFTGDIGNAGTVAGIGNYLMVNGASAGRLHPNSSIFAEIR
ncbi:MAG: C25 family cysteine peptidase [Planctomycetota bacterium]